METKVEHPALNTTISDQPAVYVGTYAKYNSGSIAGAWVDMTQIKDEEDFNNLCEELHKDEEDPEFMLQDYQSIPKRFISESGIESEYWEFLENSEDWDEDRREAYEIFVEYTGNTDVSDFEEAYRGQYNSDIDFAEDMAGQLGLISENVSWPYTCIDWEHAARELMYDYFEGKGHYFRSL